MDGEIESIKSKIPKSNAEVRVTYWWHFVTCTRLEEAWIGQIGHGGGGGGGDEEFV